MARMLGLGWSVTILMCAALTGCQSGTGARVASNNTNTNKGPVFAKQGGMPPPAPISATNPGFGNQAATPGAFPTTTTSSAFPQVTQVTSPGLPSNPPVGAMPSVPNPNNNVTFSQPNLPIVPPPSVPDSAFANPGFQPIQPGR